MVSWMAILHQVHGGITSKGLSLKFGSAPIGVNKLKGPPHLLRMDR